MRVFMSVTTSVALYDTKLTPGVFSTRLEEQGACYSQMARASLRRYNSTGYIRLSRQMPGCERRKNRQNAPDGGSEEYVKATAVAVPAPPPVPSHPLDITRKATLLSEATHAAVVVAGTLVWWLVGWLAVGPSFEPGGAVFTAGPPLHIVPVPAQLQQHTLAVTLVRSGTPRTAQAEL